MADEVTALTQEYQEWAQSAKVARNVCQAVSSHGMAALVAGCLWAITNDPHWRAEMERHQAAGHALEEQKHGR